ncbi:MULTISPECIES: hypothetical protein [unclassified Pseudonocardia]|uniref:hypothetical protein n=1 Tax=unclassified Pseudonocardia TaxID=2619320 RepID=UPI0020168F1D|nr:MULTISPECIES: hypothetical protein [unclassified Pseudonocardia]
MGTPSAVALPVPKLDRMSLRTTPDSVSTFAPLEPSPGYGPAVSSGISPVLVVLAVDAPDDPDAPHAARPAVAAPMPSTASIRRRLNNVPRSNPRPWSTTSSSGRGSGRPS